MKNLLAQIQEEQREKNFSAIRCTLASPREIRSWSFGEVSKPETINYRTFKPERDGLFCGRIFGPVRDYECQCGKYKRIKHRGVICEKCGVEVTRRQVRRQRMGHIELATPVAHIWFLKSLPSRMGMVLDMMQGHLDRILYFESYVVTDPGLTPLTKGQLLTPQEYSQAREEFALGFTAKMGGEGIQQMLRDIDLGEEVQKMREKVRTITSEVPLKKAVRRLKLLESMKNSGIRPEWMVMTVLPVLPPDLRPLLPIDGGRFTSSDLNDLYRRIINRNNRLKKLLGVGAPEIIVRNEKRLLQEAVDALLDNGRRGRAAVGINRRALKSLSDMVKGKGGRFRQNLLGKRVDYSGRSVIVVGPTLKLHQCGLPKRMALELFKPFVLGVLEARGEASTVRAAKKLIEMETPVVWDVLGDIIRQHPILLNRAPTLHRLSVQAFEPVLIEGKAIQLHPLVCTAFNADFDGDQMAVHVPLTVEAQIEARVLMMSTNNILSPANGEPIIVPSKDMVLGLYYLTRDRINARGEGRTFSSMDEVGVALQLKGVDLHARIKVRMEKGDGDSEIVETTPGRTLLYSIVPKSIPYANVNQTMKSGDIRKLLKDVFTREGFKSAVVFADRLMYMGFEYSTISGLSMSLDDLLIPSDKADVISAAEKSAQAVDQQYASGLVTQGERYNKVIDIWTRATDNIEQSLIRSLSTETVEDRHGKEVAQNSFNAVYMYSDSGARGSPTQMRQLSGIRGLMSRPDGSIIDSPITANFREGLTVLEYFMSTHGARKGLADTALKTANSGYLTRRMVDVAHEVVVVEEDCGTSEGLTMNAIISGGRVVQPLAQRVLGRIAAKDLEADGKVVLTAGTLFDEDNISLLEEHGIREVLLRSPVTCETNGGICAKCYGRDLATGQMVSIGEPVGVTAAQSIGEPGTQLTMRTFHVGGAASRYSEEDRVEVNSDGTLHYVDFRPVQTPEKDSVALSRSGSLCVTDDKGRELERYRIPYGARISAPDGSEVKAGQVVATWDPHIRPIIAQAAGKMRYIDFEESITVTRKEESDTGQVMYQVMRAMDQSISARDRRSNELRPAVAITDDDGVPVRLPGGVDAIYYLTGGATVTMEEGADIQVGSVLARIPMESSKNRDITGGLSRVVELLEARKQKEPALLADIGGRIAFGKETSSKRRLEIIPPNEDDEKLSILLPKTRTLTVFAGEEIRKGEVLADGPPNPHDILRLQGVDALCRYICQEIQDVYRIQGVDINDKHIEIIMAQMLRRREVIDSGDTSMIAGDQVDAERARKENMEVQQKGGKPAELAPCLLGITKAALATESFISAASFQETIKVLAEAAVTGRRDELRFLKENVIIGRLIPAGTGLVARNHEQEDDSETAWTKGALAAATAAAAQGDAPAVTDSPTGATTDSETDSPTGVETDSATDSVTGPVPASETADAAEEEVPEEVAVVESSEDKS